MRVLPHPRFAAPAIALQEENAADLCGRSGFWIHGDNRKGDKSASSGCIILNKRTRACVRSLIEMGIDWLEVVL